jgi:hypothetical protein
LVPEGDCLIGESGTLLSIVLGSDLDDGNLAGICSSRRRQYWSDYGGTGTLQATTNCVCNRLRSSNDNYLYVLAMQPSFKVKEMLHLNLESNQVLRLRRRMTISMLEVVLLGLAGGGAA